MRIICDHAIPTGIVFVCFYHVSFPFLIVPHPDQLPLPIDLPTLQAVITVMSVVRVCQDTE